MSNTLLKQMTIFDFAENNIDTRKAPNCVYNLKNEVINTDIINKFTDYNLTAYINDLEVFGLETTWDYICQYIIEHKDNVVPFLSASNLGELYEIGLEISNKSLKKNSGQYYTPDDVARVMSEWLDKSDGDAVCDVACGTGKLILTYLELIGYEKARKLILSGNLYLYDIDNVALKICCAIISIKYGKDIVDKIHVILCDFLNSNIELPNNCKVISNPPYAHINKTQYFWDYTDILIDTKEYYAAFMEKIFMQSKSAVIITPFSFISGAKFGSLRKLMCDVGNGNIFAFDNVPGNIFYGKKHGIFNSNTANSVRAAITTFNRCEIKKGFRVTPLIRFKNEQRMDLLKTEVLENMLANDYQVIDKPSDTFKKIERGLQNIYDDWVKNSNHVLGDYISKTRTAYFIDMPNTCRYYTTASVRKLKRNGSISMFLKDQISYDFIYCLINSSFAYWWWRIYDGGITYPRYLLNNMPIPITLLSEDDKRFFKEMRETMANEENKYIINKVNAGSVQENIKFPSAYRIIINERILKILGHNLNGGIFDDIHANFLKI